MSNGHFRTTTRWPSGQHRVRAWVHTCTGVQNQGRALVAGRFVGRAGASVGDRHGLIGREGLESHGRGHVGTQNQHTDGQPEGPDHGQQPQE